MELKPKWIIEDDSLIIGKCIYHKDLASNLKNIKGGGWFVYDGKLDGFVLYGSSFDFGKAKLDDIKDAVLKKNIGRFVEDDRYSDYKIYYSDTENLSEALINPLALN